MVAVDARYNDREVREDLKLQACAIRYVQSYQGDFEFLVRAKMFLHQNGTLPVATLRGVLNCMRSDPMGAMSLPQTPTGRFAPTESRLQQRAIEVVTTRPVTVRVQWKMKYILSNHKLAQVAHLLRPDTSELRWFPVSQDYRWYPRAWCTKIHYNTSLLEMTNDPRGRRLCVQCVSAQERSTGNGT